MPGRGFPRTSGKAFSACFMPAITTLQVDWSKKNGLLESGLKTQQGPVLTMNNISQYQSGLYTCRASNGVGQPASQHINLTVLCKYLVYLVYVLLPGICRQSGGTGRAGNGTQWARLPGCPLLYCDCSPAANSALVPRLFTAGQR